MFTGKVVAIGLLTGLLIALPALPGNLRDAWTNLQHVSSRQFFTIASRDGGCITAKILDVSEQSMTIEDWPKVAREETQDARLIPKFSRSDLLRVSLGTSTAVRDVLFSGKSSWADVENAGIDEHLLVYTKDGKQLFGSFVAASSDSLSLAQPVQRLKIAKEYVDQVYFAHSKSLSPGRGFRVLIFDRNLPEDNRPLNCQDSMRRFSSGAKPQSD